MTHSINSIQAKLWKTILFVFAFVVIGYGIFRAIPIINGVEIITAKVIENDQYNNALTVNGSAMHARTLSINGRAILIDPDGSFTDEVMLNPGINRITLEAIDIRGKVHTKEIVMTGNKITRNEEYSPPEIVESEKLKDESKDKEDEQEIKIIEVASR
ncbi:hypothetical protein A3C57_01425 [Candidatus Nomurabacteria bacterium RIFCSPHIGHO2_02_FULL_33_12]|nr:MAG: hypothetical protein A3C57_01425 [Candidatus Nomurabacteria bacterium RIFCSPHIGHO2_02_FULL_33_12]